MSKNGTKTTRTHEGRTTDNQDGNPKEAQGYSRLFLCGASLTTWLHVPYGYTKLISWNIYLPVGLFHIYDPNMEAGNAGRVSPPTARGLNGQAKRRRVSVQT